MGICLHKGALTSRPKSSLFLTHPGARKQVKSGPTDTGLRTEQVSASEGRSD